MSPVDMFFLAALFAGVWYGLAVIGYQLSRIANALVAGARPTDKGEAE